MVVYGLGMQGHGDDADSSDARSEAPARLCSSAHNVVDPVRMKEQNNTGGSHDCTRDHTTNHESKVHGGCSSDYSTGGSVLSSTLSESVISSTIRK